MALWFVYKPNYNTLKRAYKKDIEKSLYSSFAKAQHIYTRLESGTLYAMNYRILFNGSVGVRLIQEYTYQKQFLSSFDYMIFFVLVMAV